MIALLLPAFALRLDTSDAGNDPAHASSRRAFDLLAEGFGAGFNGPLTLVAKLPKGDQAPSLAGSAADRSAPEPLVQLGFDLHFPSFLRYRLRRHDSRPGTEREVLARRAPALIV